MLEAADSAHIRITQLIQLSEDIRRTNDDLVSTPVSLSKPMLLQN